MYQKFTEYSRTRCIFKATKNVLIQTDPGSRYLDEQYEYDTRCPRNTSQLWSPRSKFGYFTLSGEGPRFLFCLLHMHIDVVVSLLYALFTMSNGGQNRAIASMWVGAVPGGSVQSLNLMLETIIYFRRGLHPPTYVYLLLLEAVTYVILKNGLFLLFENSFPYIFRQNQHDSDSSQS